MSLGTLWTCPQKHSVPWAGTGVLGAATPHWCLCVWGVGTALGELWGSGKAECGVDSCHETPSMGDVRFRPVRVRAERMGRAGRQGWGFSQDLALGRGGVNLGRSLQAPGKGTCLCAQAVAGLEDTSEMGAHLLCCLLGKGPRGCQRGHSVWIWILGSDRGCAGLCAWVSDVSAVPPWALTHCSVSWAGWGVSCSPSLRE